jgi:hypothetical protein
MLCLLGADLGTKSIDRSLTLDEACSDASIVDLGERLPTLYPIAKVHQ